MTRRPVSRVLRQAARAEHEHPHHQTAAGTDADADAPQSGAGEQSREPAQRPSPRPRLGLALQAGTSELPTSSPRPHTGRASGSDVDSAEPEYGDGADYGDGAEAGDGAEYGGRPDRADVAGGGTAERPEPSRVRVVALSVAVVLASVLAGTFFWLDHQAAASDEARREGLAASVRAAETILSYDHRRIDGDIAAATKLTTGEFREDYADSTRTVVAPVAKQYKAVVKATVKASSVVSAEPEQVVVVLFVDQSTQSTRVQGTKVDQARVRITMRKDGGEWRASKVEAL